MRKQFLVGILVGFVLGIGFVFMIHRFIRIPSQTDTIEQFSTGEYLRFEDVELPCFSLDDTKISLILCLSSVDDQYIHVLDELHRIAPTIPEDIIIQLFWLHSLPQNLTLSQQVQSTVIPQDLNSDVDAVFFLVNTEYRILYKSTDLNEIFEQAKKICSEENEDI